MVGPITYGRDDSFFDQLTFANTNFKQKADVVVNIKYVDSFYMINTGDEVIQYSFNGTDVHGDMTPGKGSEALSFTNRRVDHIWFRSPSGNSASVSVGGWAGGGRFKIRTSSSPFTPASIANLQIWWEADFVDGQYGTQIDGSNTVADPYLLGKLGNGGNLSGTFDPLSASTRAKWDYVNRYRSAFFDSSDDGFEFSGTAADTTFLTKESTLLMVFRPRLTSSGNDVIVSTNDGIGTSGSGIYIRWEVGGNIRYLVNESSSNLISVVTPPPSNPAGRTSIVSIHRDDTNFAIRVNGVEVVVNSHAAATLTSTNPLRIGTNGIGSQNFDGDIIAVLAYNREITSDELTNIENYLINKYRPDVTELTLSTEAAFFFDAEVGLVGDSSISLANDLSGYTTSVGNTTISEQPQLLSAELDGYDVLSFDGDDDYLESAAAPNASKPVTIAMVVRPNSGMDTGRNHTVFDCGSNDARIYFTNVTASTADLAIFGGSGGGFTHSNTLTLGEWYLVFVVFDGANSYIDINGIRTTGTAGTDALGNVVLGARSGGVEPGDVSIATMVLYGGVLSAEDQYTLGSYWNDKYGLNIPIHIASKFGNAIAVWELDDPGVELNGSNVAKVPNRLVPGTYDLTQGTALYQPLFEATGWNGAPSMIFDGVSDYMASALGAQFSGDDVPWTWIIAAQSVTLSSSYLISVSKAGSPQPFTGMLLGSKRVTRRGDSGPLLFLTSGAPNDTARFIDAVAFSGTAISWYHNSVVDSIINNSAFDTVAMSTDQLSVGCHLATGTPSNFANVRIGAVWIYAGELDAAAIAAATTAMAERWPHA